MTTPNIGYVIVGIALVEVVIPWNIGIIRSRADKATPFDVLKDTVKYSRYEILIKFICYVAAMVAYRIDSLAIYSAVVLMTIGAVNLFYLRKGQPQK